MLLLPLPSALSAHSPDGFVSLWSWEQAVCSLPCPGLPPSARRHPPRPGGGWQELSDSIPDPTPSVCLGLLALGLPICLLSLSSSLVLQLRHCSLPPLSLSGLLAGPVQPGFRVGMGWTDSSAGPLSSPAGHRSPTPASQGSGGGRERPFSLQCILAIRLSAFLRLCRASCLAPPEPAAQVSLGILRAPCAVDWGED